MRLSRETARRQRRPCPASPGLEDGGHENGDGDDGMNGDDSERDDGDGTVVARRMTTLIKITARTVSGDGTRMIQNYAWSCGR